MEPDKNKKPPSKNFGNEIKILFNYRYKMIGYFSFAAIFLLGFALAVMPQVQGYRAVKDVESFRVALEDVKSVKASLQQTQKDLEVMTPEVMAKLNLMLPATPNDSELVLQVKDMVERAGFNFSSLSFQKPKGASNDKDSSGKLVESSLKAMDMSFTAEKGTYEGFKQLLTELYQHERLIDIKTVSFSGGDSIDVAFQARAFILP